MLTPLLYFFHQNTFSRKWDGIIPKIYKIIIKQFPSTFLTPFDLMKNLGDSLYGLEFAKSLHMDNEFLQMEQTMRENLNDERNISISGFVMTPEGLKLHYEIKE